MSKLVLYHGSSHVIKEPQFGRGNPHNDYGLGFYCTENKELAKEWGTSEQSDGFANCYELDQSGLSVLDLNDGSYTILHWLSILLQNRVFRTNGDIAPLAKEYLTSTFEIDYQSYDIIRGYRADDSYFSFANAFLNNALSLSRLERAMMLGGLGEQVVLKSERAFNALDFVGADLADATRYYPLKIQRDTQARSIYREKLRVADLTNEVTILTIMQENWRADDARLRRVVSR